MSLGVGEVLFLVAVLLFWILPVRILIQMAGSKGRSKHFAWWAVGLGWLGFIVAAIIIAAGSSRQ